MNILFINLTEKQTNEKSVTTESFKTNLKDKDVECTLQWKDSDIQQNYYKLLDLVPKKKTKDCDYVCLLPEGSTLSKNYRDIIEEYVEDSTNVIYMPLGIVANNTKNGLFNTIFWSNQCIEPGELDHDLALKQTDTVLFGALIPKELFFDESYYNKDLKLYQHYQLLNQWSKLESIQIKGIPKLLVTLDYDLSFNKFSQEVKLENYKLASQIELVNA